MHAFHTNVDHSGATSTVLLTDFSKAFDRVDHTVAIKKLIDLEVDHSMIAWIADFLSDRKQRVKYKDAFSTWSAIQAGEGSNIGPVVFLAMINDFMVSQEDDNILQFKYVDDLTLIEKRSKSSESKLSSALHQLHEWSATNRMHLNVKKCLTMDVCFTKDRLNPTFLTLDDQVLQHCNTIK